MEWRIDPPTPILERSSHGGRDARERGHRRVPEAVAVGVEEEGAAEIALGEIRIGVIEHDERVLAQLPALAEAARVDGASPMRFFFDILLPMSRTNIAALFVILFIYGWNQYLWPLLITTDKSMYTIVMGIKQMFPSGDDIADWPVIMATSILAMVPPVLVVIGMQKLFIRGLVESEK